MDRASTHPLLGVGPFCVCVCLKCASVCLPSCSAEHALISPDPLSLSLSLSLSLPLSPPSFCYFQLPPFVFPHLTSSHLPSFPSSPFSHLPSSLSLSHFPPHITMSPCSPLVPHISSPSSLVLHLSSLVMFPSLSTSSLRSLIHHQ